MLTLFKKKPRQSANEIIEEIHQRFYNEADFLLQQSKKRIIVDTDLEKESKGQKLIYLGFDSAPEAQYYKQKVNERMVAREYNEKQEQAEKLIQYFAFKYPMYKFITEESVVAICKKYGLVYSEVSRYKGEVPAKNLEDIRRFSIKEEDKAFEETKGYVGATPYRSYKDKSTGYSKASSFEIVAPLKDFNFSKAEIRDFRIVNKRVPVEDPIVLQPVISPYDSKYSKTKYYLIVTAWGLEAKDPDVINPIQN